MSIAELKILDVKPKSDELDESSDFEYIESFHPAVLRLLATGKLNDKNYFPKAYGEQEKISFKCNSKLNLKQSGLLNKKVD